MIKICLFNIYEVLLIDTGTIANHDTLPFYAFGGPYQGKGSFTLLHFQRASAADSCVSAGR